MPGCYNFDSIIWSMPFQWKHNQFSFLIIPWSAHYLSLLDLCIKRAATNFVSTLMIIIFDLPTNFCSLTWWRWLIMILCLQVWVAHKESSWISTTIWIVLLICFGRYINLFFLSPQTPASYHYYLLNTKSIYCVLILLQYLSQVAKSCSHAWT